MTLSLSNPSADVFVPDGADFGSALARTTHLAIGAHQDDLEFMAAHGVVECFQNSARWFTGVVVTDGAGSARDFEYKAYSNEQMMAVRRLEQRKAAFVGEYSAMLQLGHPSQAVKDAAASGVVVRDVPELHFMEGIMKAHGGARTLVTVTPDASGNITYVLQDDKDQVKGVWQPRRGRAVIPDDEPLSDWNACWSGSWKKQADGKSTFKPRLAKTDSMMEFGDVRKALRAGRRQGKK